MFEPQDWLVHRSIAKVISDFLAENNVVSSRCFATRHCKDDDVFGCHGAIQAVASQRSRGSHILKGDFKEFFPSVSRRKTAELLALISKDDSISHLIEGLPDGCFDELNTLREIEGFTQGSPMSPIMAFLYATQFDSNILNSGLDLVRYVDDFVVFSQAPSLDTATLYPHLPEGLELHPKKTKVVGSDEVLDFLGVLITSSGEIKIPDEAFFKFLESLSANPRLSPSDFFAKFTGWWGYFKIATIDTRESAFMAKQIFMTRTVKALSLPESAKLTLEDLDQYSRRRKKNVRC